MYSIGPINNIQVIKEISRFFTNPDLYPYWSIGFIGIIASIVIIKKILRK